MSNVTIKFWDKKIEEYADSVWLAIDDSGDIYDLHRDGEEIYETVNHVYEPHFYKNGERIDV